MQFIKYYAIHKKIYISIRIAGILLLGSLVACNKCKPDTDQNETILTPITDEMIRAAETGALGSNFLPGMLRDLKDNKKIDINATDPNGINGHPPYGYTGLYYAVKLGNLDIVKALLERGAKVNVKTTSGYTPLLEAAAKGNPNIVKLLLAVQGIEIDATDCCGQSALYLAAEWAHLEVVQLLLGAGINVNLAYEETSTSGVVKRTTALKIAQDQKNRGCDPARYNPVIEALKAHGS